MHPELPTGDNNAGQARHRNRSDRSIRDWNRFNGHGASIFVSPPR